MKIRYAKTQKEIERFSDENNIADEAEVIAIRTGEVIEIIEDEQ